MNQARLKAIVCLLLLSATSGGCSLADPEEPAGAVAETESVLQRTSASCPGGTTMEGEIFGHLYDGPTELGCGAVTGVKVRLTPSSEVLTALTGRGYSFNGVFDVDSGRNPKGAFHWHDINASDGPCKLNNRTVEQHPIVPGSTTLEGHCVVPGKYTIELLYSNDEVLKAIPIEYFGTQKDTNGLVVAIPNWNDSYLLHRIASLTHEITPGVVVDLKLAFNIGAPVAATNSPVLEIDNGGSDKWDPIWRGVPNALGGFGDHIRVDPSFSTTTWPDPIYRLQRLTFLDGTTILYQTGFFWGGFSTDNVTIPFQLSGSCVTVRLEVINPDQYPTTLAQAAGVLGTVESVPLMRDTRLQNSCSGSALPDLSAVLNGGGSPVVASGGLGGRSVTIADAGPSAMPTTLRVYFSTDSKWSLSDCLLQSVVVPALQGAPNQTVSLTTSPLPGCWSGSGHLLYRVDHFKDVIESSESNNVVDEPVQIVATAPDFVIDSVGGPDTLPQGGGASASVRVRNTGSAAGKPSSVRVYLSDNPTWDLSDTQIGALTDNQDLPVGAFVDEPVTVNILQGQQAKSYYLIGVADAGLQVLEVSNSNNVGTRVGQVQVSGFAHPDLQATIVKTYSDYYTGQTDTIVSAGVWNAGTSTASSGWVIRAYISADSTWDIEDLVAGSKTITSTLAPSATIAHTSNRIINTVPCVYTGNYYVIVRLDATDAVAEGSAGELNNVRVVGPILITRINGCTVIQ